VNVFIATIQNEYALLTPEESWHCCKVLRKKEGDLIQLIDGLGNFFEGRLEIVSEKQCTAKVLKGPRSQTKRSYYLHLAIAPTKQIDRIEWMLEKAVEIGLDEISFIQSKNSERSIVKTERLCKIVESAVKQSLQAYLPKVNGLSVFKDILKLPADQKLIAHCEAGDKHSLQSLDFKNKKTLILIGPEGDFSHKEIEVATSLNYTAISLGENRLRSETAGLYVCQAAALLT